MVGGRLDGGGGGGGGRLGLITLVRQIIGINACLCWLRKQNRHDIMIC